MNILFRGDDTDAFENPFMCFHLANDKWTQVSKLVFQCGKVIKQWVNPVFPLHVSLNHEDTLKLRRFNRAYFQLFDSKGRRITYPVEFTFYAEKQVVNAEKISN